MSVRAPPVKTRGIGLLKYTLTGTAWPTTAVAAPVVNNRPCRLPGWGSRLVLALVPFMKALVILIWLRTYSVLWAGTTLELLPSLTAPAGIVFTSAPLAAALASTKAVTVQVPLVPLSPPPR